MESGHSRSVIRLVELGICEQSDIEQAKDEAAKLSTPEYSARIKRFERIAGAAGDSTRIKILLLLTRREMCVCELESALGMPQPTVSHHLGLLERADLVERYKRERWAFYRVRPSPVLDLLRGMVA